MKFFTLALTMAVGALAMPAAEKGLQTRDISLTVDESNALNLVNDMLKTGELIVNDVGKTVNLDKRFGLLDCDRVTAFTCIGTTAGVLNGCFWAAITRGADIKDDASCIAAATALGSNIPAACKTCLHLS